jgi:hypothetical protein
VPPVFDDVLAAHPEIRDGLDAAFDAAWTSTDPALLELCRLRIAMLLRNTDETTSTMLDASIVEALPNWATSPLFGAAQRACLEFAEQFVLDVGSMTDAQVGAVTAALGPDRVADFVHALLVVEQRQRLGLAWQRLFAEARA